MKKIFIPIFICLCLIAYVVGYSTTTTTTNLLLVKPASEDTTVDWFDTMNDNMDLIDAVFDTVTLTEFAFLDGVTSAIQTQLNAKPDEDTNTTYAGTANEITLTGTVFSLDAKIARDTELHAIATINATANGLSLLGQEIALGLASTSNIGALSNTDWNIFNGKQAGDTALTNISALAYVSPSLIKLTADDTYAVRTLAEIKTDLSLNYVENLKVKLDGTAAPAAATDDETLGYAVGSRWFDVTNDKEYVCLDNTDGAAVWTETTGAGGGASQLSDLSDVDLTDIANLKILQYNSTSENWECETLSGGGDALIANGLNQFAATTSAELAGVISDETGTGKLVFETAVNKKLNSNYIPTETTPAAINTATYDAFGITARFNSGKLVIVYREGASHDGAGDYGIIRIRTSTDEGKNWSAATTIDSEANVDLRNVSGTVTPTGRLIIKYTRYDPDTPESFNSKYYYSDDEGINWTSYFKPHTGNIGSIITIGDDKLLSSYSTEATDTDRKIMVMISSDNGLTWGTPIEVVNVAGLQLDEPSFVYVGGSEIIGLIRITNGTAFRQVKSIDNGVTWTDQGNTTFDSSTGTPPWLSTFISLSGQRMVNAYYLNRTTNVLRVISGLAKDLIASGVSAWQSSTLKNIASMSGGYPSVIHPFNNPYGMGWFYNEISASDADITFFTNSVSTIVLTGGQIAFPATAVPSANANTLDDYEEGEWTMGVSFGGGTTGITYSATTGYYTKIGNLVTISGYLQLTSKGTDTGNVKLTGLPFTVANSNAALSMLNLCLAQVTFANQYFGYVENNATTALIKEITEAGAITNLTNADFANNSMVLVGGSYRCQ